MERAARSAVALCALTGCSEQPVELPPLDVFTDRISLAVLDEHPPCAGDLAELDAHVAEVEELFGLTRDEPIEVYLGTADNHCDDAFVACYRPDLDAVFTPWQSVHHELGHAVEMGQFDFESTFWSEGFAEVSAGSMSKKSQLESLTVGHFSDELPLVNYVTTGHVARYLVETYGWVTYRSVLENGLEDTLAVSAESFVDEYESNAPAAYPSRSSCSHPPLATENDASWSESLTFSCETPEATQYEHLRSSRSRGAAILRAVELEAGTYELESVGGEGVVLLGCLTDELDELPDPGLDTDVPDEVSDSLGKSFSSGSPHQITVRGGTYRIAVSSGSEEEATVEIHLRRLD